MWFEVKSETENCDKPNNPLVFIYFFVRIYFHLLFKEWSILCMLMSELLLSFHRRVTTLFEVDFGTILAWVRKSIFFLKFCWQQVFYENFDTVLCKKSSTLKSIRLEWPTGKSTIKCVCFLCRNGCSSIICISFWEEVTSRKV
jgi:hypothetical protein